MSYDLSEYRELREAKAAARRAQELSSFIDRSHQAAVEADKVLADPHWRLYAQLLSGTIEKLRETANELTGQLTDTMRVSHDDLLRTKVLLAEVNGMIAAFDTAISLPRAIKDDYAKAESALAKLMEKQSDDSTAKAR